MRYILKVALIGFTVRYEGKRGIRMTRKFFALSNWVDDGVIK